MRLERDLPRRLGLTLLLLAAGLACSAMAACSEAGSAVEEEDTEGAADASDADATSADTTEPDLVPDDTSAQDTELDADVEDTPEEVLTGLANLYCGLTDDTLLAAAARAAACIEGASLAGILDDAARGFVAGPLMHGGYGSHTFGNCDYLACLRDAPDCAAAVACDAARRDGPCDVSFQQRCDGNELQSCQWTGQGEEYVWLALQDCGRVDGGGCIEDAERGAKCTAPVEIGTCPGYYGGCDGTNVVRCDPSADPTPLVTIDCSELVAGGTCIETAVGGEAPGPTCSAASAECTNSFAEGFACDEASGVLEVCLYGRIVPLDCRALGYSGCSEGSFFSAGCLL